MPAVATPARRPPGGSSHFDLRVFDDPTQWATGKDEPLLDEHRLVDPNTGRAQEIDAAFLEEVARNGNARAVRKGTPVPFILGHTEDNGPEKPVEGYYYPLWTAPDPSDPSRRVLMGRPRVRPANQVLLERYPRRSVELWVAKREIDPVARLGGTTPERDLTDTAVIRYSREGGAHYRYECEDSRMFPPSGSNGPKQTYAAADNDPAETGDPPGADTGDDEVVSRVMESAPMKALMAKIDQIADKLGVGGDGEGVGQDDVNADLGGMPGEGEGQYGDENLDFDANPNMPGVQPPGSPGAMPPGPEDPEARRFHEPPPVRFDAMGGGGYPSAESGFVPGGPSRMSRATTPALYVWDDEYGYIPYHGPLAEQPAQYQRQQPARTQPAGMSKSEKVRFSRIERENAELKADRIMGELHTEGVAFGNAAKTRADLVKLLIDPSVGDRGVKAFVDDIRVNYARREQDPAVPADVFRYQRDPGPPQGPAQQGPQTMADLQRAINAAKQPGETWDEVQKRIYAQPNGTNGVRR